MVLTFWVCFYIKRGNSNKKCYIRCLWNCVNDLYVRIARGSFGNEIMDALHETRLFEKTINHIHIKCFMISCCNAMNTPTLSRAHCIFGCGIAIPKICLFRGVSPKTDQNNIIKSLKLFFFSQKWLYTQMFLLTKHVFIMHLNIINVHEAKHCIFSRVSLKLDARISIESRFINVMYVQLCFAIPVCFCCSSDFMRSVKTKNL